MSEYKIGSVDSDVMAYLDFSAEHFLQTAIAPVNQTEWTSKLEDGYYYCKTGNGKEFRCTVESFQTDEPNWEEL